MAIEAAIIGTGPEPDNQTTASFAMGYLHAEGYTEQETVELVGCADIVEENAAAFADEYDLPDSAVFEDYERLLDALEPDIVSVTVPPSAHADIVEGCVASGIPAAIHCEKPMADTWGGARSMASAAADADVQLTFNHQRRFGDPYREAKRLLDAGEIGALERIEVGSGNLFDYGSHQFDLAGYFADQPDPEWILAGLDYREENLFFGTHNENQASATWRYDDGVDGVLTTGTEPTILNCHTRLVGSAGEIVIGDPDRTGPLHVRSDGDGWRAIDTDGDGIHEAGAGRPSYITRGISEVVSALDHDEPSSLRAENALQATALIFGAFESVRRRGRVDDPLSMTIDDNPLAAMVESGALTPE